MRTLVVSLLLVCASILSAQTCRVDTLLSILSDGGKSDYVMIFAHRGDWRIAPENSLKAFQNCIDEGLDGIEVDVQLTKDSILVVMHDQTLERTTTGKGKVSDYTYSELQDLYLKSPIGVVTRQKIPTFEDVLKLAKGKILIQVDKWTKVKEHVIELAKKHDCLNHLVFRSSKDSKYVNREFEGLLDKVNYIPVLVCKGKGDSERLDDFLNNIQTSCIGVSFKSEDFQVLDRMNEISKKGFRVWLNSLWADFNAGHDDELATFDLESSYGWLLQQGANIIFTDHPMLLKDYLDKKGRRIIKSDYYE